jgi:trimeric autotransporter adhesin
MPAAEPMRLPSGQNAKANANNATTYGNDANAAGVNAMALGQNANALADNSSAVGNGGDRGREPYQCRGLRRRRRHHARQPAKVRHGEQHLHMAGITSNASKAAQGAPTTIVTSNLAGDLAAYTVGELGLATQGDLNIINNRLNALSGRTDKALSGVAMAFAMAGVPELSPGERFR